MLNMVVGPTGKEKKGPRQRWIDNNREYMRKYEPTADMTENRQYMKLMVSNGEKAEKV